jgi:hypothetical protein
MDWRFKCAAFYVLGWLPRSVYRAIQRRLGSFHIQITDAVLASYSFHVDNFVERTPGGVVLEIGSGANLLVPLLLSKAGASRVYAFDLERHATVEQVNHVIEQLRARGGEWPSINDLGDSLASLYRIEYRAPADARSTRIDAGSVDFICTTSVLEHIPATALDEILAECLRIGSSRMTMSHNIGYIDHYAHADGRISYFNFYKFADWLWPIFNPPKQYQNRLRHSDFERLFAKAGLRTEIAERVPATEKERHPAVRLAKRFRSYSEADLFAHDGLWVLSYAAK